MCPVSQPSIKYIQLVRKVFHSYLSDSCLCMTMVFEALPSLHWNIEATYLSIVAARYDLFGIEAHLR